MPVSHEPERDRLMPDPSAPANADDRAIAALGGVVGRYRNTANWYNNASFLLPLAATLLVALAGALLHSADLLGFAAFLGVVTGLMAPVVLLGWRQTPTTVVLTQTAITTVHHGTLLKSLEWRQVTAIRRRETQGNVRWEIADAGGDRV